MVCLITDMLHSFSVCFHVYALCWLENMTADFLFYLCVTPLGELFTDRSECLAQRFASPLLSSTLPFKSFTPQLALPSLFKKKKNLNPFETTGLEHPLCQSRVTQSLWHFHGKLSRKGRQIKLGQRLLSPFNVCMKRKNQKLIYVNLRPAPHPPLNQPTPSPPTTFFPTFKHH